MDDPIDEFDDLDHDLPVAIGLSPGDLLMDRSTIFDSCGARASGSDPVLPWRPDGVRAL